MGIAEHSIYDPVHFYIKKTRKKMLLGLAFFMRCVKHLFMF